jgi:DNA-binding IscR family transcriptional regulator
LAQSPHQITVRDVLYATESSLFEITEDTVSSTIPEIEQAMQQRVFNLLDNTIKETLQNVTLYDLVSTADKYKEDQGFMFYI